MLKDLDQQISDARQAMERREAVDRRLSEARDEKINAEYRIQALESYVAQADAAIREFESSSLGSIISTLTGSRDRKIAAKQVELQTLQEKQRETIEQFQALQAEVSSLEAELKGLTDLADQYESLCKQKRNEMFAAGGSSADELKVLNDEQDRLKAIERQCRSAIDSGEAIVRRVNEMSGAVGRARSKTFGPNALGAIGNAAFGAVAAQGARPTVQRVTDGLNQFLEQVRQVECGSGTDLDIEIMRVTTDVDQMCVEMAATSTAELMWKAGTETVIHDLVYKMIGLLQGKLDHIEKALADNDRRQQALFQAS